MLIKTYKCISITLNVHSSLNSEKQNVCFTIMILKRKSKTQGITFYIMCVKMRLLW